MVSCQPRPQRLSEQFNKIVDAIPRMFFNRIQVRLFYFIFSFFLQTALKRAAVPISVCPTDRPCLTFPFHLRPPLGLFACFFFFYFFSFFSKSSLRRVVKFYASVPPPGNSRRRRSSFSFLPF